MTKVDAILKDPFYTEYIDKNVRLEADRRFCGHSFQHLLDVARIAYILMLERGSLTGFMEKHDLSGKLAKEVIYASALLHDIGRWKQYETGEDHAVVSAELAYDVLERAGFDGREIDIIKLAITEHRRCTGIMSILGEVLCRADKLSRLCTRCGARDECHKIDEMETGRETLIY